MTIFQPNYNEYIVNGKKVKITKGGIPPLFGFTEDRYIDCQDKYIVIDSISEDGKNITYREFDKTFYGYGNHSELKEKSIEDFYREKFNTDAPKTFEPSGKYFNIGGIAIPENPRQDTYMVYLTDKEGNSRPYYVESINENEIQLSEVFRGGGYIYTRKTTLKLTPEEFMEKFATDSCQLTTVAATESEEEAAAPTESEVGMVSMVDDSSDLKEELTGKDGVTSELEQSDNPKINIIHGRLINSNVEAVVQGVKDFMKAHTSFDPTTYVDKKFSIQKINGLVINQSTAEEYKHEKFPQPIDKSNNDILQEFIETYNENSDKIILKCEENKNILIETKEPFNEILELNKLTDVVQGLNSNKSAVNNIQKVDSIITLYNSQLDNLKKAVTKLKMEEQLQKEKEKLEQIKRMNDEVD